MKWETVAMGIIVIVVGSLFSFLIVHYNFEEYNKEGIVTGKYILPRSTGEPVYYLVLDNETDVKTFENYYYSLEIGDYYKSFKDR